MSAARMNIGTAIKEAGRMPAKNCWTMKSILSMPPKDTKKPMNAPTMSGIIMGKPKSKRTIIVSIMPAAIVQAPSRSFG